MAAPGLPCTARRNDVAHRRGAGSLLRELLMEAGSTGAHTIHVEPSTDSWQVRLRRANGLDCRRVDFTTHLGQTLGRLARRQSPWYLVCKSGRIQPTVQELDTFQGKSWLITLGQAPLIVPTLDELVTDHDMRQRLQQVLTQQSGLVLLSGKDHNSTTLLRAAVAQHCIAPDRRVLRLERTGQCHPTGSIGCTPDSVMRRDHTRVTDLDADVLVLGDTGMDAQDLVELARQASRSCLVVLQCTAHDMDSTLTLMQELDPSGAWITLRSVTLVRHDELILLCSDCRSPVVSTPQIGPNNINTWLETVIHPANEAEGCNACYHSGIGATQQMIDVLDFDKPLLELWQRGERDKVRCQLEERRHVPQLSNRSVRAGLISESEASRVQGRE